MARIADEGWKRMQEKTFTKWCNLHLGRNGKTLVESLEGAFHDGLLLRDLLEVISNEKVPGKMKEGAKMRIQKIGNVDHCVKFILAHGIKLVNIGVEDIADGNLKLILGLVWTLIEKFDISDIQEGDLNAKDALLLWCKKKTKEHNHVAGTIVNFHKAWKNGLAFCALIHAHKPALIDYNSLDPANDAENLELAFSVAEGLGIPRFLDVADIVEAIKPDERSVMTYVAQYYAYFASGNKADTAARRIEKLMEFMRQMKEMQEAYNLRASEIVKWSNEKAEMFNTTEVENTLAGVVAAREMLRGFQNGDKPPKASEKSNTLAALRHIQTKLKAAGRPPFVPPAGCEEGAVTGAWTGMEEAEAAFAAKLRLNLARQKKIANLLAQFRRIAAAQSKFNDTKTVYVNSPEEATTLSAAQSQLKQHEGFNADVANSQKRIETLNTVGAQLLELQCAEADEVSSTMAAASAASVALQEAGSAKEQRLRDTVEREMAKEELRKDFAQSANEAKKWFGITKESLDRRFGNTLTMVQEAQARLEAEHAEHKAAADGLQEQLSLKAAAMEEAGIDNNRYTPLTVEDIAKYATGLEEAQAARLAAWQAELERQQAMETKRVEFATTAQAHVDLVSGQQAAIDALTGEPDAVAAGVDQAYQDGAAAQASLQACETLDAECRALGITTNEHTQVKVPQLRSANKLLSISVKNFKFQLEEEKRLASEYAAAAAEISSWAEEAAVSQADTSNVGNTLQSARAAAAGRKVWKLTEMASAEARRSDLQSLVADITSLLEGSSRPRPAFEAPAGLATADIDAKWAALEQTIATADAFVNTELARQEKLALLVRQFQGDSEELEGWLAQKDEYLSGEADVSNLTAARMQTSLVEVEVAEVAANGAKVADLKAVLEQITELGYEGAGGMAERFGSALGRYEALPAALEAKRANLAEALAAEEAKEAARLNFKKAAVAYVSWARDKTDTLSDPSFGFTFDEVIAFRSQLEAEEQQVTAENASFSEALAAAAAELAGQGVTDNRHTSLTADDVATQAQETMAALAARAALYDEEVARQNAMEEQRKVFAAAVDGFLLFVDESQAACQAEGADVTAAWGEGAAVGEQLEQLRGSNGECITMGITANSYTKATFEECAERAEAYNNVVMNLLASIEEDAQMLERAQAMEQALVQAEEAENRRLQFSASCNQIQGWVDSTEEVLAVDVDEFEQVEQVSEAEAALAALQEGIAEHQQANDDLAGMEDQDRLTAIQQAFAGAVSNVGARGDVLAQARAKQEGDEQLRDAFVAAANASSDHCAAMRAGYTQESKEDLNEDLNRINGLIETHNSSGEQLLNAVIAADEAMVAANISADSKTAHGSDSLRMENETVGKNLADTAAGIAKEIARLADSGVSAEQLAEFKEAFDLFDKDKSNTLTAPELKACMQAMGDEPSDEELVNIMATLDTDGNGTVSFDEFVPFMSNRSVDQDSLEQIVDSFRIITEGKPVVTKDQLLQLMAAEAVEDLCSQMEERDGGYDYEAWAKAAY